ncbi:adenosylmethionine--8-amino-7-oxononanoate transaminase [Pendulispora albinea]|uniref:Adenosylmethionine-8-amino-7-oxononanoate aminotransferase n=1 Tax=Pendulispora albinea TaxID=2741071 RepID=A0ABZ2LKN1_9BACT
MTRDEIVQTDKAYVWHPYTAMDEYIDNVDPFVIARAQGAWLEDVDGRRYLDGNSSWYVAVLGHAHPRLVDVLKRQADSSFLHCSLAGTTHAPAALLAEELVAIAPRGLTRVFYTDNGSGSVEVALRMALQMHAQTGAPKKRKVLVLEGAYHGDTLGAASLGGIEVFRRVVGEIGLTCLRVPFPEPDAYARAFEALGRLLREGADETAAIVIEPMLQASAGMRNYDAKFLVELRALADRHDVLLVADEVFTGYGRTGTMWAMEHAGVAPDIMCLGKAFASLLPMGATLATERVFDGFRGSKDRALFYGHTFCGHPLGAALAREVLAIFRDEQLIARGHEKALLIERAFARIAELPGVARVRNLGMVGAADLAVGGSAGGGYLGKLGWRVYEEARRRGAYLRPLGDTVYVTPPLTIPNDELAQLLDIVHGSIEAVMRAAT